MPRRPKESSSTTSTTTSSTSSISMSETLTGLEALPAEIRTKLDEMGAMDEKSVKLLEEAEQMTLNYMTNVKRLSRNVRCNTRSEILRLHDECCSLAEKKVTLAKGLSETVDNHIKHLDESLSQYEDIFYEYLSNPAKQRKKQESQEPKTSKKGGKSSPAKKRSGSERSESPISSAQKELSLLTHSILKHAIVRNAVAAGDIAGSSGNEGFNPEGRSYDMPLDPHEPTYCICHNVSYGEMVGCDNPDCQTEWFHFACVGLTEQPDGEWYCPRCVELMPKRSGKAASANQKIAPRKKFSRK